MPVDRGDGVKSSPAVPSTTPIHGYFLLSPVSLASRDQDGGQSDFTIDIYAHGKIGDCEQSMFPRENEVREHTPVPCDSLFQSILKGQCHEDFVLKSLL